MSVSHPLTTQSAYRPGDSLLGQTTPNTLVILQKRSEDFAGCNVDDIATTHADASGQFTLPIPTDAQPTYNGQLFRILWQITDGNTCQSITLSTDGQPIPDPYQRIGLYGNPFVAEPYNRTTAAPDIPPTLWLDRGFSQAPKPKQSQLVQIIGVKGAGKSSHLAQWRKQQHGAIQYYPPPNAMLKRLAAYKNILPDNALLYIASCLSRSTWQRPPVGDICYWDEACRIPLPSLLLALWRGKRQRATICAGTHRDLSRWAKLFGLNVTTISLDGFSCDELQQWANARIKAARISDNPDPSYNFPQTLPPDIAAYITKQAQGSWREATALLHVWAAKQVKKRDDDS
ncbi:hypothetical protein KRX19_01460 [Cardiobacteriaceae bacterium TAE3-ERU3]|nr:hypothetical protein [Cardiobacteriaceae bacterium TAE3-ERU3]